MSIVEECFNRDVAVTGMGCISAAGSNCEEHEAALPGGSRNCGPTPDWLFKTKLNIPVFSCAEHVLNSRIRSLLGEAVINLSPDVFSRTFLLLLAGASEALDKANLSLDFLRTKKVGIAIGTTVGCTFNDEQYYEMFRKGGNPPLTPVYKYFQGNLAHCLQSLFGLQGPSAVITNACASGTDAIGTAFNWLRHGLCDIAVAGGADELSRIALNGFTSLMLTDVSPCRPFDQNRQGLNLGEGAGVLVLESDDSAQVRGVTPYGWVRGYATRNDAWHPTAPHPEGEGLIRAVQAALAVAGKDISPVLINAHGTGTPANDAAEEKAIRSLFQQSRDMCYVSTKGLTGHTLGAAGGIEAILTLITLLAGSVWGTVGCRQEDASLQIPPLVEGARRSLAGCLGLSQSLAFGGGNSALLIEGNR